MAIVITRAIYYMILLNEILINLSIPCSAVNVTTNAITPIPDHKCSTEFGNATASPNCTRYENTSCSFECNLGYERKDDVNMSLLCTREGWESSDDLCEDHKCSTEFGNATSSPNCTRYENTSCSFECNLGYERKDDVNMSLLCTREGWESSDDLCEDLKCDAEFGNATASSNCTLNENTTCSFECSPGYERRDDVNMTLLCTREGWERSEILCEGIFHCDRKLDNAEVSENCSTVENATCEFECADGYQKMDNETNMNLTCTRQGWEFNGTLCINVKTKDTATASSPTWPNYVIISVVIALGVFTIVLAIVVVVIVCQKRRIKDRLSSFSNVSMRFTTASMGIDNPGYRWETDGISSTILEEPEPEGDDSTDPARKYSLSQLSGVDLDTDDAAVLTSDSWQRERSAVHTSEPWQPPDVNMFPEHLQ